MNEVINDLHCSILVRTNHTLSDITQELGIQPTRCSQKGDILSKCVSPFETNVWAFERVYKDFTSVNTALEDFLTEYSDLCQKIAISQFKDEMCLRLFIQSDYAQIGAHISPKILSSLYELGIPLEISIFSWGKA